jgi:hypothetical protein
VWCPMWSLKPLFVSLFSDDLSIRILYSIKWLYNWWIRITGEKGGVNYFKLLLQHLLGEKRISRNEN